MALERIMDHVRRAILHLPPSYWGKPRIASCLRALVEEVQELEDAIWDVLTKRAIDTATGAQLETLGRLVGEPDLGYDESTYRVLIHARIRINRGRGSIADVIEVLRYAYSGTTEWSESDPAHLNLVLDEALGLGIPLTERLITDSRAAGVAVTYALNPTADRGLRFGDASSLVSVKQPGSYDDAQGLVSGVGAPLFHTATI